MAYCNCGENEKTKVLISCKTCGLTLKKGSLKKKLKYLGIIAVAGYAGGQFGESIIFDSRYPVADEFTLINGCINSSGRAMTGDNYLKKQEKCLCALEYLQSEHSYLDFKMDKVAVTQSMFKGINKC